DRTWSERTYDTAARPAGERRRGSTADAEALDQRTVTLDVVLLQVLQEALALTDQQHQTTARVVIVLVGLEVLGQVGDAVGEQRGLDLGRTGVALAGRVLRDDRLLGGGIEGHTGSPQVVARRAGAFCPGLFRRAAPERTSPLRADTGWGRDRSPRPI